MWLFVLGLVPALPLLIGIVRFLWPDRKAPGLGGRTLWYLGCDAETVPARLPRDDWFPFLPTGGSARP